MAIASLGHFLLPILNRIIQGKVGPLPYLDFFG
jgi:hypothetical protein